MRVKLKKIKGVHNLIKALHLLKEENNLCPTVLIAGDITNPKDEPFSQEIKKLSEGVEVKFLGWIPHQKLPQVYEQADIFVLPSYSEALPQIIIEAMASSLPVIATETSGAKDLVEDGKTGFLVPIGDPIALKEKIKILLENPDLRKTMGEAGRKRIEKLMEFAEKKIKNLLEKLGIIK